jgi:sugar phosphate isomerase/epimerase
VLEFLPILGVRTLTDAVRAASDVGDPRVGVLVDALHLARAGQSPADVAALDPALFPYLQICDADAEPPEDLLDEALHGRQLPGDGGLPIAELLAAVPDVPLSFELRSRALREAHPDPLDRARAVRAAVAVVGSVRDGTHTERS